MSFTTMTFATIIMKDMASRLGKLWVYYTKKFADMLKM